MGIAFFAILGVAWLACESYHARTSDPTGRVSTYAEYRAHLPTPLHAEILHKDGAEYYSASGPITVPLVRVSGPPTYVFDLSGHMVDWTLDRYDDARFQKTWETPDEKRISVSELDAAFKLRK